MIGRVSNGDTQETGKMISKPDASLVHMSETLAQRNKMEENMKEGGKKLRITTLMTKLIIIK